MIAISITEIDVRTVLRAFLLAVLPVGVEVVAGQDNRVPEPKGADFVTMTPLFRERLATNEDGYADVLFTGSISGNTLTVSDITFGALLVGLQVFGANVADGTAITALGSGSGGVGTYTVSPSQTVASGVMSAGSQEATQATKFTMQLDVHGPNGGDNAQTIATLLRDDYACEQMAASGFDMQPLYASDPKQVPFINGESQYEERWVVEAVLQINPVVTTPQQFAGALAVDVVEVDAAYPPS